MKKFTDLYSIDEFIAYYGSAKKSELRNRLKSLKTKSQSITVIRNEVKAIEALLA